jgi:hypothetical protein
MALHERYSHYTLNLFGLVPALATFHHQKVHPTPKKATMVYQGFCLDISMNNKPFFAVALRVSIYFEHVTICLPIIR